VFGWQENRRQPGDAKVNELGARLAMVHGDQHVCRLDIAVNDALLVGVLDRARNLDEQL